MCEGVCEGMQMMTLKWLMSQRGLDNRVFVRLGEFDYKEAKQGTDYEANKCQAMQKTNQSDSWVRGIEGRVEMDDE